MVGQGDVGCVYRFQLCPLAISSLKLVCWLKVNNFAQEYVSTVVLK